MLSRILPIAVAMLTLATTVTVSSPARAENQAEAVPSIELVDVFSNTGQALVYDSIDAEYVLLRAGSRLRTFKVGAVLPDRIEIFRADNTQLRFVLTKPTRKTGAPATPAAEAGLMDPYGTDTTDTAETSSVPAVEEPEPIKTVRAPAASRPASKPGRALVSRSELDTALADLEKLSREVELELVPGGTRVAAIGEGTLPYRLGLRRGDIIRSVAGVRTTQLEDGADVFVKLSSAKKFDIEITRDKETRRISVAIQSTTN